MKTFSALSELARRTKAPPISWLMHLALARPKLISLAAGFTDPASLPLDDARALCGEILRPRTSGQAALQYGSAQGDPTLRRLTGEYVRRLDGRAGAKPVYSPQRIILTNGSQQLLYIVTEALCDPDDIVLVEDPTYFVYLGILQSRGVRARGIRLEADGIELAHLERVLQSLEKTGALRRVKALYLVSYFQNPTGICTSLAKKAGALSLLRRFEGAAGHPIYLVEDAAYRELRFTGPDTPSALWVSGAADRVVYGGTFSKPFATGIRVGFGMLPEPVFTAVLRIKGNHDFGTSNFLQQLMARALASGRYARHLAELRRRYSRKARVMRGSLRQHFPPEVEWTRPEGGLYFWARLPRRMKTGIRSELFQAALGKNILYVPGEVCYADDPARRKPNHEIRLSFGNASEPEIREGVARLGKALRKS